MCFVVYKAPYSMRSKFNRDPCCVPIHELRELRERLTFTQY